MVFHVQRCCCACSLKQGTIIIGILGIIASLSEVIRHIIESTATPSPDEDEVTVAERTTETVVKYITGILLVVDVVLCVLLIHGARKEKPDLIKPWLYFTAVSIAVMTIMYVAVIIFAFLVHEWVYGLILLVIVVVTQLVSFYFIVVVNSYLRELTGQHRPMHSADMV